MTTYERTLRPDPHGATMGGTHVYGAPVRIAHDGCDPQRFRADGALHPDNVRCWTPVYGGAHPCYVCGEVTP